MNTIWSSAVSGDEISVDLHLTEQAAFDSIRDAWGVPDAVPDERMAGFLAREYEVEISIQEHPLPAEPKPTAADAWADNIRTGKDPKCGDPMCLCKTIELEEPK